MPLLVFRIEKGKWLQNEILQEEDPSADAIQSLRVANNSLSVWEISDESELPLIATVLATTFEHLDSFDMVMLDDHSLADRGLKVIATPGETKYAGMANRHRDVAGLDYWGLGNLMECTVVGFKAGRVERIRAAQIRDLLKRAIENGSVKIDDLRPSVQKKVTTS